jgi:hypothetical protein
MIHLPDGRPMRRSDKGTDRRSVATFKQVALVSGSPTNSEKPRAALSLRRSALDRLSLAGSTTMNSPRLCPFLTWFELVLGLDVWCRLPRRPAARSGASTCGIASFTGDGACDRDGVYRTMADRQREAAVPEAAVPEAAVIVPPRSTAVPRQTATTEPTQRDRPFQCILKRGRAEKGRIGWRKASGYNNWSRVEATVGRYKQAIAYGLCPRKGERRTTEVRVAWRSVHDGTRVGAIR